MPSKKLNRHFTQQLGTLLGFFFLKCRDIMDIWQNPGPSRRTQYQELEIGKVIILCMFGKIAKNYDSKLVVFQQQKTLMFWFFVR